MSEKVTPKVVESHSERGEKIYGLSKELIELLTKYQDDHDGDFSESLSETYTALYLTLEIGLRQIGEEAADAIIEMHTKLLKDNLADYRAQVEAIRERKDMREEDMN